MTRDEGEKMGLEFGPKMYIGYIADGIKVYKEERQIHESCYNYPIYKKIHFNTSINYLNKETIIKYKEMIDLYFDDLLTLIGESK